MASLLPTTKMMFLGNDGNPLVGGKLYTYDTGTTTPRVTYQDAAGTIANTNPVILDARGEALIFWSGSYRVKLCDADDNLIWTVDSVSEIILNYRTGSSGSAIIPAGPTASRDAVPQIGYFRYNTDLGQFEGYGNDGWGPVGGGGGAGGVGGGDNIAMFENDVTITDDYEIGAGAYTAGVTITIASPAVFTLADHGLKVGTGVRFKTTGTLPTGITAGALYYVISAGLSTSTFQVSSTVGGSAINASDGQTGEHSVGKAKNSMSAGTITVIDGVTVTIPDGSTWTVV